MLFPLNLRGKKGNITHNLIISIEGLNQDNVRKLPVEFGRTVIRHSFVGFTLPKSAILMCPSAVSSKFSGWQHELFSMNGVKRPRISCPQIYLDISMD